MSDWYFRVMGEDFGPLSDTELQRFAANGQIAPDTLVRQGADGPWVTADRAGGLFPQRPTGASAVAPPVSRSAGIPTAGSAPNQTAAGPVSPPAKFGGAGPQHASAGTRVTTKTKRFAVSIVIGAIVVVIVPLVGVMAIRSKNPPAFESVHRAAKRIEGSLQVGVSRAEFRAQLQEFATELAIAKEQPYGDKARQVLEEYAQAMNSYQASQAAWAAQEESKANVEKAGRELPDEFKSAAMLNLTVAAPPTQDAYDRLLDSVKGDPESFFYRVFKASMLLNGYIHVENDDPSLNSQQVPIGRIAGASWIPATTINDLWAVARWHVALAFAASHLEAKVDESLLAEVESVRERQKKQATELSQREAAYRAALKELARLAEVRREAADARRQAQEREGERRRLELAEKQRADAEAQKEADEKRRAERELDDEVAAVWLAHQDALNRLEALNRDDATLWNWYRVRFLLHLALLSREGPLSKEHVENLAERFGTLGLAEAAGSFGKIVAAAVVADGQGNLGVLRGPHDGERFLDLTTLDMLYDRAGQVTPDILPTGERTNPFLGHWMRKAGSLQTHLYISERKIVVTNGGVNAKVLEECMVLKGAYDYLMACEWQVFDVASSDRTKSLRERVLGDEPVGQLPAGVVVVRGPDTIGWGPRPRRSPGGKEAILSLDNPISSDVVLRLTQSEDPENEELGLNRTDFRLPKTDGFSMPGGTRSRNKTDRLGKKPHPTTTRGVAERLESPWDKSWEDGSQRKYIFVDDKTEP